MLTWPGGSAGGSAAFGSFEPGQANTTQSYVESDSVDWEFGYTTASRKPACEHQDAAVTCSDRPHILLRNLPGQFTRLTQTEKKSCASPVSWVNSEKSDSE